MTDIPVLFSAPMVNANNEGRKSMTRRDAWRAAKPNAAIQEGWRLVADGAFGGRAKLYRPTRWQKVQPGDRLWVRETFAIEGCGRRVRTNAYSDTAFEAQRFKERLQYIATDEPPAFHENGTPYWWNSRPSIHMPRWASRTTLIVTAVKMERVQDISDADALAEGIAATEFFREDHPPHICFSVLWDTLHGPGAWDANPEVVAISYTVHQTNIDKMETANNENDQ